ncbi:MAG: Mce-associated rane protein [Mycobacterium sp.]|nr:Mce-associated rane protein [Mycobacterium sp.]
MTGETTKASDDDADDERVSGMTTTPLDEEILETDDAGIVDATTATAAEADEETDGSGGEPSPKGRRRQLNWSRIISYGVLPALALILFMGAGYLKWTDTTIRDSQTARTESVQAARDGTVALLSYTPADVDKQLVAARDLLTGDFRNSYTSLTNDVVIPGAKQQQITAVATVPAASSVSASVDHAVALVFVDQTTTVGSGAPTALASTVRVALDKVNGRWLISQFDPV